MAHGLDNPCHINIFRLSELRSNSRDDTYKWASESGFCIILGSFQNCEFNLFCYDLLYQPREDPLFLKFRKF